MAEAVAGFHQREGADADGEAAMPEMDGHRLGPGVVEVVDQAGERAGRNLVAEREATAEKLTAMGRNVEADELRAGCSIVGRYLP